MDETEAQRLSRQVLDGEEHLARLRRIVTDLEAHNEIVEKAQGALAAFEVVQEERKAQLARLSAGWRSAWMKRRPIA
jgi:signal transduction protein with GAF and PtsI domain